MLKLSTFKLAKGYWSDKQKHLTLVDTHSLEESNADHVICYLWGKDYHDDALKFFAHSYKLLLNYFDGDASKFCVVRNCEFCNFVYVIHV